jgi:hypothetical protein
MIVVAGGKVRVLVGFRFTTRMHRFTRMRRSSLSTNRIPYGQNAYETKGSHDMAETESLTTSPSP